MNDIPYFEIEQDGHVTNVKFDVEEWHRKTDINSFRYDLSQKVFERYIGNANTDRLREQLKADVNSFLYGEVRDGRIFKYLDKWETEDGRRSERIYREEERKIRDKVKEIAYIAGVAVISSVHGVVLSGGERESFSWAETEELYKVLGEALKTGSE